MWGVRFSSYADKSKIPNDSIILKAMDETEAYSACPGTCRPNRNVHCKKRGNKNDYKLAMYRPHQGEQLKGGAKALCVDANSAPARTATTWDGAVWGNISDALREQIPPTAMVYPSPPGFYDCSCPPGKKPKAGVRCVGVQTKWVKPAYRKYQKNITKREACQ